MLTWKIGMGLFFSVVMIGYVRPLRRRLHSVVRKCHGTSDITSLAVGAPGAGQSADKQSDAPPSPVHRPHPFLL